MSIQSIQTDIQTTEQYKIRKQSETQQAEQTQQTAQEVQKLDEYDKANPVGEEVEGIYSVSHDDEGNLKVDYKQPTAKSESTSETKTAKAEAESEAKSGGAAPVASASDDSDDDDDELEELKEQRDTIKQQLNRTSDEETKAALRAQLQALEVQIALKSSD